MKFLIDANLARSVGLWLKNKGHEVHDIRDIRPAADDHEIYNLIKKESYILVTKDLDFSNLRRFPPSGNCGIILLRVFLLTVPEILALLEDLLKQVNEQELKGSLTVVRAGRYRIHKL